VRGMDHLTNILNYLEVRVLPFKVPVSRVLSIVSEGIIKDEDTKKTLEKQAEKFIKF
jgi:chromate reductase, NAD(P)H dehydrogenase (quinone)